MNPDPNLTLGSLVAARPTRARIFEEFKLDYCCRGHRTLADACERSGIDVQRVLERLDEAERPEPDAADVDWTREPLQRLVSHIVATHHTYLRDELPSLAASLEKLRSVHGSSHPELLQVATIFHALRLELEAHMAKEENVLFPYCNEIESATELPRFHCGTLANPIRVMEHEHDIAGDALRELRRLTNGYQPPADGCGTYRASFQRLAALESDLHQHIHLENNILFPRVLEAEKRLAG